MSHKTTRTAPILPCPFEKHSIGLRAFLVGPCLRGSASTATAAAFENVQPALPALFPGKGRAALHEMPRPSNLQIAQILLTPD